ncbi:hypothetical protein JCGZ_08662 [Jatropha curcas]|uniref:Uncharacterized protein n=1 Tax=Jatropha curcas TaxID=180498 RepID=A0A067KN19_JATCU|nr:hypothetical protein JCGZ_08662 [Jatropha curcas]
MDCEHRSYKFTKKRGVSILQGNEFFFNKVISRNSSVGCSSGVFYYRSAEGVPFQWEMQPGTPKNPPKEEILPPLSPPPAMLSLGLPKPNIVIDDVSNVSIKSRLKFWKYFKKSKRSRGFPSKATIVKNNATISSDKFDGSEFCSSDEEFMVSPRNSSSSSSSMSLSFSNRNSRQSSRSDSSPNSPWNFTSFVVCVARHIR